MFKRVSVLIFLLAIATLSGNVLAVSNIDLQVSPQFIETCPDRTLTSDDISITIKNLYPRSDTFSLSIEWVPNSYSAFIQPEITLASGEEENIETFWINVPYTLEPRTYTATIKAVSYSTGERVSKDIGIKVLGCHAVDIEIEDASKDACMETELPVSYSVNILNTGKFFETFDLSVKKGTETVSWADFSESSVAVSSGSSKTVTLTLDPPTGLSGTQNLEVIAVSRESYAQTSEPVSLNLKQCYDFSVEITPSQISDICLGRKVNHTLKITNKGSREDSYSISGPIWASSISPVRVSPGSTRTISFTSEPPKTGINTLELIVTSSTNPNLAKEAEAKIDTKECKDVVLMISPIRSSVCRKESGKFLVTVKNTGTLQDTFSLSTSLGALSKSRVVLDTEQVEIVELNINTENLTGTKTITITATDGVVTKQASAILSIENCYEAELSVTPDSISVCPHTITEFSATLKNTGTKPDRFRLGFVFDGKTFPEFTETLDSGTSKDFKFNLQVEEGEGVKRLDVFATSSHTSLTASSQVDIKSMDTCYSVSLVTEDTKKTVKTSKAVVVPITVKNTGEIAQEFSLNLTGPQWAYLRPQALDLEPEEEENVYVYISPIYQTLAGNYKLTLVAVSAYVQEGVDIEVSVISNITAPPEENITEELPEENITAPPEEENITNITLNATFENITSLIVEEMEERPFWKIAVIVIITLIIIVILVVRFVLLVKK